MWGTFTFSSNIFNIKPTSLNCEFYFSICNTNCSNKQTHNVNITPNIEFEREKNYN